MNLFITLFFLIKACLLVVSSDISQFYQKFIYNASSNFSDWTISQGNNAISSCSTNKINYDILGGPNNFDQMTTMTSILFNSQQQMALFYQMHLYFKIYQNDFSANNDAGIVMLQILINDTILDQINITTPSLNEDCNNSAYYLNLVNTTYDLSTYNFTNFTISMKLWLSNANSNYQYSWGITSLFIKIYECDTSLCSRCSYLPRNCSAFCAVKCKNCLGNSPNQCSTCYDPDILDNNSNSCMSSNEFPVIFYFDDSFNESTVQGLRVNAILSTNEIYTNWTHNYMSTCGPYLKMFGGFEIFGGNSIFSLGLKINQNHYAIRTLFRFVKISSWDNETFHYSLEYNESAFDYSWQFNYDFDNLTGYLCGSDMFLSSNTGIQPINLLFNHTQMDLTLIYTTDLNQDASDEAWGIKDLLITAYACAEACDTCYGPTNSDCNRCKVGYFMVGSTCLICDPNCSSCYGSATYCNSCYSTSVNKYLSNNKCVSNCAQYQYPDSSTMICTACVSPCLDCSSNSYCLSCNNSNGNFYFLTGKCLTDIQCQSQTGYYSDYSTSLCSKCDETCSSCSISPKNCSNCAMGYFASTLPGFCTTNCPKGLYNDTLITKTCQNCDKACKECYGGSNSNCTVCNDTYFTEGFNSCVSQCSGNTTQDSYTNSCMVCAYPCKNCSQTPQTCQSCATNYNLFKSNSTCNLFCPPQYFSQDQICVPCNIQNSTCDTCFGPYSNNCLSCSGSTYFNRFTNECVTVCPDGTVEILNICQDCDVSCQTCIGTSPIECSSCQTNLYLQNKNASCLSDCDPGYYKDAKHYSCELCNSECLTCESPARDNCLSCKSETYLYAQECLLVCNSGYYNNQSNWICSPCYQGCDTCLDGTNTSCSTCIEGYYLYEDSCVKKCPSGMGLYNDVTNRQCSECSFGCADCNNTYYLECISCQNGFYLYLNFCSIDCSDGLFQNNSSNTCDACDISCETCVGPTANDCLTCYSFDYLYNNTCLSKCPYKYFANDLNNVCDPCSSICLSCEETEDNCSVCNYPYYLDNNTCLSRCPDGKFQSNNSTCDNCNTTKCKTCMTENECLSCSNGTYPYYLNRDCLSICPLNYFGENDNNRCMPCDKSCSKCTNASNSTCQDCVMGYYLLNSTCLQNCPAHFYEDKSSRLCVSCDPACENCSAYGPGFCSNCSKGYYLNKYGTCVNNCGDNYFPNDTDRKCDKCSQECLQCYGPSNITCTKCINNYYYLKSYNSCYLICPSGYYNNISSLECTKCDPECKTCSGYTNFNCKSCNLNAYFYQQKCLSSCPDGYYPNKNTSICNNCHNLCQTCYGPSNGNCTKCSLDLVLNDGLCQANGSCPSNKWQNNSVCQLCNSMCESCNGGTAQNCTSCKLGTYLLNNECLYQCPHSLVAVDSSRKCLKICNYTCADCVGPQFNECNSCPMSRYLKEFNGNSFGECHCQTQHYDQSSNLRNFTCLACHISCLECSGPAVNECTECRPYNILVSGRCECPIGQFLNITECQACSPSCKTCIGPYPENCTSCHINFILNEKNICVCDSGFFANNQGCSECDYSCQECNGPDNSDCIECAGNHISSNGLCNCPFWSEDFGINATCTNKTYLNCHKTCNVSKCIGPNSDQCVSCRSDRYLESNTCYCKDGTYEDSSTLNCNPCHSTCKKCAGPLFSNCIDKCISDTRGSSGLPINGVCDCKAGYIENLVADCEETPVLLSSFSSTFKATIYVDTPSIGIIALSESTIVAMKFIETCQLFSYLSYMNLQYPLNTKNYFNTLNYFNLDSLFVSVETFDDNNNNSTDNISNSSNSSVLTNSTLNKKRFLTEENQFDRIKYSNKGFIDNAWIMIVINGSVFGLAVIYSLFYYFLKLNDFHTLTLIYKILRWNFPLRVFSISCLQILFYIALEFKNNSNWGNINGIITILVMIFLIILLIYFFKIINTDYSNDEMEKYYGVLWDGINTFFFIKRNYFFFNFIRKALVVSFITSVTLDAKTQLLGCMISCLLFLLYLILARPFISNLEWIFTIIMEFCFCFLLIVIFTYTHISYDNATEKIRFGYAIIISLSLFMLATFIFAMIHIIKFLRKVYLIFKNREKNNNLLGKSDDMNDDSALASKIGQAFNEYKKGVDQQKKVIVVYNQEKEEKQRKKEEERIKQVEMNNRLQEIELEKKNRAGLQTIFAKQKNKTLKKKKDSFMEEEENDTQKKDDNNGIDEAIKQQEVIKNRIREQEEKKKKDLQDFFNKQKNKTIKKKNSFEDDEDGSDEEEKNNLEMKNFENL